MGQQGVHLLSALPLWVGLSFHPNAPFDARASANREIANVAR